MADLATLKTWLAEAELARHKLMSGKRTVAVNGEGRSITYSEAAAYKLDDYIASLKMQITRLEGRGGAIRMAQGGL